MGLDAKDVRLNVDGVFGADVTLGLDRLDMKWSRDIVNVIMLGLVGERLDVRVNIEIISRHDSGLIIWLESVSIKGYERPLPERLQRLCGVDKVELQSGYGAYDRGDIRVDSDFCGLDVGLCKGMGESEGVLDGRNNIGFEDVDAI